MKENANRFSKAKKRFTVFMNRHAFLRNMLQIFLLAIFGFLATCFGLWLIVGLLPHIGAWELLALAYAGLLIGGKFIIEKSKYNRQILPLIRVAEKGGCCES